MAETISDGLSIAESTTTRVPSDGLLARRERGHELDAGLMPEEKCERLGEHLVVVDDEDAEHPGHIS